MSKPNPEDSDAESVDSLDPLENNLGLDDVGEDEIYEEEYEEDVSEDDVSEGEEFDKEEDDEEGDNDGGVDYKKKKKCMYNFVDDASDEDSDNIEDFEDDQEPVSEVIVQDTERIAKPRMTKYERVRLISDRANQIARGAKPMIKFTSEYHNLSPKEIAELELKNNTLPLLVIRPLPNGKQEIWKVNELEH